MRRLLRRVLETENYLVVTAENGKQAVPLVEKENPDLVITDYRMPEMDGVELIRALKSGEATAGIPIIMVTVEDEVEPEVEVFDAGAADYLTKPLSKKRLLIRVKRVLRMVDGN
jgi:DNA-binding response OmpR family regulator